MNLSIDMIATNLGSGTKTYNINFCKHLNNFQTQKKIFVFITRDYLNNIDFKIIPI